MSGLPPRVEEQINGLDVREQGSALRVATNTPHLVSLGTGRLSTAVTLHPIKQGRVTIGSDPTCDIHLLGDGVANLHCRVENSHGSVTLYPLSGATLVDAVPVTKPRRLSQGCMLTIGRSNYLRFNHPEEAKLLKSVLPREDYSNTGHQKQENRNNYHQNPNNQSYNQSFNQSETDINQSIKNKPKPPVPRKPQLLEIQETDSEKPKISSIMAKVSKFEYYAKTQQKNSSKSQFYTNEYEISPKVFTSNSVTTNMAAKDVLVNRNAPTNMQGSTQRNIQTRNNQEKTVFLHENNAIDSKTGSYANVSIRNRTRIDDIVRNFDLPKKVNNDSRNEHVYGKINNQAFHESSKKCLETKECYGVADKTSFDNKPSLPSPAFDRNPEYSPVYNNSSQFERSFEMEHKRVQAYQDRMKEEEVKLNESARLEEILSMCAEYERQASAGTPVTPTEKRSHNKIITNGSLPRSVVVNNPNFIQTTDGYYKFETNHSRNNSLSRSLPPQRNVSSYENYDVTQIPNYPQTGKQDGGRMDEIGIPIYENHANKNELSSPILIRKVIEQKSTNLSPSSPYDNMYSKNVFKPKSPSTQSPRSRIKTTFAHKNVTSPQYFVFPTPPPVDNAKKPNFTVLTEPDSTSGNFLPNHDSFKVESPMKRLSLESPKAPLKTETESIIETIENQTVNTDANKIDTNFNGIEKQLSLEEEIPMIDDSDLINDIEFRTAKTIDNEPNLEDNKVEISIETNKICKNQSFDDVKKELMADIPELDEFERDLKENRVKIQNNAKDNLKRADSEVDSANNSMVLDVNLGDLRAKYDSLKEQRKKLLSEIHEHKNKMSEIRAQEDDILRELEMEKALIKGEYDSEIAILNIEQKKRTELLERSRRIDDDIRCLKIKQEARQGEMKERVKVATLNVERIQTDLSQGEASIEELQNARDVLENETKLIEDLEFTQLEEETELLQAREDLQSELATLTKKIDSQKTRILTLKSEANNNLTGALDETKILQAEYVRLLNQVEKLTLEVQHLEKVLKPLVVKLNDLERTQSPDSAFFTDQTRVKSGDYGFYGYSPQTSDSDENDLTKTDKYTNYQTHAQLLTDKFNSIDQMSQSMTVDIERRDIVDIIDELSNKSDSSPSKSSGKEKKGFWERNFDSLKRKKKAKAVDNKVDIMSQSLNENLIYNNEIENDTNFERNGSLRLSKSKKEKTCLLKSNSSKIPTLSSITKIIKKDSFGKKNKDVPQTDLGNDTVSKIRYTKNVKTGSDNNKYSKKTDLEPQTDSKNKNLTIQHNKSKSFDSNDDSEPKNYHRKSCGDEPNVKLTGLMKITDISMTRISDSGKIPSQDDIDRISKITLDAPIFTNDTDMNSLGKKTLDSLMEIERNRMVMLEEQGCQVIENEREKISELKRRAQNETKKLWDQKCKLELSKSFDSNELQCHSLSSDYDSLAMTPVKPYRGAENFGDASFLADPLNLTGSTVFEDSSGLMSASSIEELQVCNSRAESTDGKLSDDSRPLSHASDLSRDQILSSSVRRNRLGVAPYPASQRPLTRYLPQQRGDLDLRTHLYTAGHQVDLCPHVLVTTTTCRGYLHKLGAKFHTWSKRWFVFDRDTKTFVYYWDKTERKPRGGAYFQVIEEVYLDHGNTSRSPSPQTTFIVKTRQRKYHLLAPSSEAVRIWIDVIFTGAHSYNDYLE